MLDDSAAPLCQAKENVGLQNRNSRFSFFVVLCFFVAIEIDLPIGGIETSTVIMIRSPF